MTKLLENIHRPVNIGLINEMKIVADKMGIDIQELIRTAATKPFGFAPYYPGLALEEHCVLIDPFYLAWKAHKYVIHTRFIELAGKINSTMPDYVLCKVLLALNVRKMALHGNRILVPGIAYKKNDDDQCEPPSPVMMKKLRDLGAELSYSNPHVPTLHPAHDYNFELPSIDLRPDVIRPFDLIFLLTNHDRFDDGLVH